MSQFDIYKYVAYEFLNKLFSYMTDRDLSVEDISRKINIDADKLDSWFDGDELPNGDEIGIIEDFLESGGKQKEYPIEKQYVIKKFDEYRVSNKLSYSKLKELLGLKSKSAIHYWINGEKQPSEKYIEEIKHLLSDELIQDDDIKDAISYLDKVNRNDSKRFTFPEELKEKSDVELSNLLDVSRMTIHNWKNNKKLPNDRNLKKINSLSGKSTQKIHKSTQEEIAKEFGIHRVTYSRWRNGKQKPRYKNFVRLLKTLENAGVSLLNN